MIRTPERLLQVLSVLLGLSMAVPGLAQNTAVAVGLPPFGTFSGGPFDFVNNANLNVHFEIPVVNKAGRGLPFVYTLTSGCAVPPSDAYR